MQEKREIDIILLKRFFNKQCSIDEQEIVMSWFVDSAYEQKLSFILKRHWDEIEYEHTELDETTGKVLDKIHHQINLEKNNTDGEKSWPRKVVAFYSKIAAVLLIPILGYSFYTSAQKSEEKTILIVNQEMAMAEIVSPLGGKTHFTLPDGSSGWLNSGATLEFPVKFTGNERRVKLTGEGWFDVIKNPDIPFVVNTMGIDVIALGTKFNVLAYPDDKFINVTLESGKVIVKQNTKSKNKLIAELKPGDQVKISKQGFIPKKETKVEIKTFTSWKQGMLVIRNEPMSNIVKRLERWYNVKIEIRDKEIESYMYRATFQDETIDEVLSYLKLTSPLNYEIEKRETGEDNILMKKKITFFLDK